MRRLFDRADGGRSTVADPARRNHAGADGSRCLEFNVWLEADHDQVHAHARGFVLDQPARQRLLGRQREVDLRQAVDEWGLLSCYDPAQGEPDLRYERGLARKHRTSVTRGGRQRSSRSAVADQPRHRRELPAGPRLLPGTPRTGTDPPRAGQKNLLQDADNLGWKLSWCCRAGGDPLLDSTTRAQPVEQASRRPQR